MADPGDIALRDLLAAPARPADEAFVARVAARIEFERRLARAHRAVGGRLWGEIAGTLAVGGAFAMLARLSPDLGYADLLASSGPAMAGVAILALWVLVGVPQRARIHA